MKKSIYIAALAWGACVVQAQLPVEPAVTAPKNSAAQPLAMDWAAGFSRVTPGQLSQRGNASYGAELLHSMAALARAFDAQDAAATAAARERVLTLVKERPDQLNDVAVSADGKWLYTPLTIAFYMQDGELLSLLVEAGALPYLPGHTLLGGDFCQVHTSPHAEDRHLSYWINEDDYLNPLELYLQARAAGVGIRTDGFVPPAAEAETPVYPRRLPSSNVAHYGPDSEKEHRYPLEYLFIPGDPARRDPHEAYRSELMQSYSLLSHAQSCPIEHECYTEPEMRARFEYELRVHPEQVDDVFLYWGECNQSPFNLVQLCMREPKDAATLDMLFSHGALPFTPSRHVFHGTAEGGARVMQERAKFLSPLETALQAQARGVNVRPGALRPKREDFITGTLDSAFAKLPQGMRHPDSAAAAALAERVGDFKQVPPNSFIGQSDDGAEYTPQCALLQGWELWQQEMPELLRRTAEAEDATLRSPHGFTALQAACLFGESSLIESLLERGAAADARPEGWEKMGLVGETPLALLVENKSLPLAERKRLVRLLLMRGAAVDAPSLGYTLPGWLGQGVLKRVPLLERVGQVGMEADMFLLLLDKKGQSVRDFFTANGKQVQWGLLPRKIVRLLLECGVDPNAYPDETGRSLLQTLVKRGDVELVRLALDKGADANHVSSFPASHPLLLIPLSENVQDAFSDPHDPLPPFTPDRAVEIAKLLLDHGAAPDAAVLSHYAKYRTPIAQALHTYLQSADVQARADVIKKAEEHISQYCADELRDKAPSGALRYKGRYSVVGFFSISQGKWISTRDLPEVLVFYADNGDSSGKTKGGDGHFYCDAHTGDLLGYVLGK